MPAPPDSSLPPRPAPIDPRALAERAFATTRRGFEPGEVRAHLRILAEQIATLQDYVGHVEGALRAAKAAPPSAEPRELDIHQVASLVGEETARVLETARAAAEEIRAKAEDNAGRLVREAAEEATVVKSGAEEYAARLRREAEEEATAARANADRYASELRRATDAEVDETRARAEAEAEEIRRGTEEHAAATRADGEDYAARVRAEADDYALAARSAADDEASRVRAEADSDAERTRAEAEAAALVTRDDAGRVLAMRSEEAAAEAARIVREAEMARDRLRAEADGVVESAEQDAAQLVREAETVRDRVLHDLARRRKQAKAHLEQLEAARARLLSAYDLVRATADEATRELNTVLPEARTAASEALHRALAEPDAPVAQIEAELAAARDLGLPLVQELIEQGLNTDELAAINPAVDVSHRVSSPPSPDDRVSASVPDHARGGNADAVDDGDDVDGGDGVDGLDGRDGDDVDGGEDESAADRRRGGLFSRRRRDRPGAEHGVILPSVDASPVGSMPPAAAPGDPEAPSVLAAPDPSDRVEVPAVGGGELTESLPESLPESPADPAPAPEPREQLHADGGVALSPQAPAAGLGANPAIGDLFARIRAAQDDDVESEPESVADPVGTGADQAETGADGGEGAAGADGADGAADAGDDEASEPPDSPEMAWRKRRDKALASFEKRLAKRLKRTLADEESDVLDRLRKVKGRPKAAQVLPDHDEVLRSYVETATPLLREAAAEGDSNVADIGVGGASAGRGATDVSGLAGELSADLVELLRPRVERAIEDAAAGDDPIDELELADHVRACYREWRTQRLTELVRHSVLTAFTRGLFDGVPDGVELTWVVDDSANPCPDCADNVLAGAVPRGSAFPTEHLCPPAHPGCRCFVVVAPL